MQTTRTNSRARLAPQRLATGGALIHRLLQQYSVDVIFGHTGAVLLPLLDELAPQTQPRFVVARHERSAGYMALGYARGTGKPGVVLVTSGPGATNTVAAVQCAWVTATPLIVLTGQVATAALGTQAFQEADITGITRPITKWSRLVMSAADLPLVFQQAFDLATSGRPGPVLVDLPKDVLAARDVAWEPGQAHDWRAAHPARSTPCRWCEPVCDLVRDLATQAHVISSSQAGAAVPLAIGHLMGDLERPTVAVQDAGSFSVAAMELATAVQHALPLKTIVTAGGASGFDVSAASAAFGVRVIRCATSGWLTHAIGGLLACRGAALLDLTQLRG